MTNFAAEIHFTKLQFSQKYKMTWLYLVTDI